MRIEKVNDNQIRCFLSREEMESRQLHLKELAYGTEKAKRLFHDLMQEAYQRFGFEAENLPVMVEAVPMHDDSLVLIVTKVDNPEELDTRFSSFAPSVKAGSSDSGQPASALGQLLDAIRREIGDTDESSSASPGKKKSAGSRPSSEKADTILPAGAQLYTFTALGQAADAACLTASVFDGKSALYRDPADAKYYLFLTPSEDTDSAKYTRALSAFSEFGTSETITPAREQYLLEHCEVICAQNAVQSLARLGR
jgi:adapter protein MecA 1/2